MFLGLIFFLELTAGILAFVFKDWIKDQLNFFINNNVKAYRDDIDLQNLIDFAQEYVSSPPPMVSLILKLFMSLCWKKLLPFLEMRLYMWAQKMMSQPCYGKNEETQLLQMWSGFSD